MIETTTERSCHSNSRASRRIWRKEKPYSGRSRAFVFLVFKFFTFRKIIITCSLNKYQSTIWLRKKRNTQAAYAFLKRLFKHFGEPKVLVTDKAPSIACAFKKLQNHGFYQHTEHRTVKYLNNLIEQDHRPIKRRNKFYRSLRTAATTIKGMETIRGLFKKNRKEGFLFGFSICTEINGLLGIPA